MSEINLKNYIEKAGIDSAIAVFIQSLPVGSTFVLNDVNYIVKDISPFVQDEKIDYVYHKHIFISAKSYKPFKIECMKFGADDSDSFQYFFGGKRYLKFIDEIKQVIENDLGTGQLCGVSLMLEKYIKDNWENLF